MGKAPSSKKPLVSVIIPIYNGAQSVSTIIESTLNQTERDIELILVDDGSTDSTPSILKSYKKSDKRVVVVSQRNQGPSAARNAGIQRACGEYVMFFDSDDDCSLGMVKSMVRSLESGHYDMAVCGVQIGGNKQLPLQSSLAGRPSMKRGVLKSILTNGLMYSPWNKIYRRELITRHVLRFDTDCKFGEDLIFNLEYLSEATSVVFISEALYSYNRSTAGLAHTTAKSMKYRKSMGSALYSFYDTSGPANYVLVHLIKLRWRVSVLRASLKGST